MRDPLHRVPVRYKLTLLFVAVCLLAFGVGGYLVTRSANDSLGSAIRERLELQAQAYASALDRHLQLLQRRTEDFASDGYLRDRLERLQEPGASDPSSVRADLEGHLRRNKLPLVADFVGLSLLDAAGSCILECSGPSGAGLGASAAIMTEARSKGFSSLVTLPGYSPPAAFAIGAPVTSVRDDRVLGWLLSWVHPGVCIVTAFSEANLRQDVREGTALSITDASGRTLRVGYELIGPAGPRADAQVVRTGLGLEVADARPDRDLRQDSVRTVLARSFPVASNDWKVNVQVPAAELVDAVARLQSRFVAVGGILALVVSLLLFFPLRFLARPLQRLREAAQRLEHGQFAIRVPVESEDEVGELAQAFNHMAQAVEERTIALEGAASDLRQRQDELRRESDRLATVIAALKDGLVVLDGGGRPVLWNAAARPLLEGLQGQGTGAVAGHHPCGEATRGRGCIDCLTAPAGASRTCLVDLGASVLEVHTTRLPSEEPARAGRVLLARDVTDRIHQDERQIHQERLAVLGEVASVMAHELNNPLAAISMFSQMIETEADDPKAVAESAAVIRRNTETCKRTIRELLDYATAAPPEVGAVDVREILEDVERFLRPMLERKDLVLALEVPEGGSSVLGDEVQIRQVFVNLVVNALQAIGDRGGRIRVAGSASDDHLVIDVIDSGAGVPEEARAQIFRPFFTTKPRGEGTGLGLSTARRITELHGGSLELLSSRPGETVFRVRLRRQAGAPA